MPLKVVVKNFQSIEHAELVIDGLTVLTGTNNAGKSALFRAIRGAATNTRGTFFVRHGTSHATVELTDLETKDVVKWEKGDKGINRYTVNGKKFDRVGHGVPEEAQILGIKPMKVGDSELWPQIAPQITGVSFLLDQTGSVIAEAVADVERVQQLNRALKDCESDRRSTRADLKVRKKDRKKLLEEQQRFVGLDDVLKRIEEISTKRDKATKFSKALLNLIKLGDRYRAAKKAVEALDGLDQAAAKLPSEEVTQGAQRAASGLAEVQDLATRYEAARDAVEALEGLEEASDKTPSEDRIEFAHKFRKGIQVTVGLAMRYEEAALEFQQAVDAQAAAEEISLDEIVMAKAEKFKKALGNARALKGRYDGAKAELSKIEEVLEKLERDAAAAQAQTEEILGTYSECPTCGGALDHVH